jgi:hypothetical protein
MKTGSNILNLNPSTSWCNGATRNPKEEDTQECAVSGKNHGYILLIWERCYACELLACRTKVNSVILKHIAWKLTFVMFVPHEICQHCCSPMTKLGHTSVHTMEAIGCRASPHPPYSPDLAPSDFHLFGPWKCGPWGHNYTDKEALHNAINQWLQRKESNFY